MFIYSVAIVGSHSKRGECVLHYCSMVNSPCNLVHVIDRVINNAEEGPSPLQGAGEGITVVSNRDEPLFQQQTSAPS